MTSPQPGWYPDPSGAPGQRYFDGTNWTVAAPTSPPSQPLAKKSRKWLWIAGGAAVVVVLIAIGSGGKEGDKKAQPTAPVKSSAAMAAPGVTVEKDQPTAGIGNEVRDGKFAFVVSKIDMGQKTVGRGDNQFMQKTAQGEWALMYVTVTNIGDKPQTFFAGNQKLIADGKTFSSDASASMYLSQDSLMTDINPGNKVSVIVAFDVPVGTKPATAVLHDSAFSGGAPITLSEVK